MIVRLANHQDLDKILEIEKLSFSNPWDAEFLINISKDIFLVFGKQQIYGFLIAGCCHRNINATILKIAVHPEHRRKGIGTNLLYKLFDILKDRQILQVDVIVNELWEPAMLLYKKVGFKIISTVPQAPDHDGFCEMRLELSPD